MDCLDVEDMRRRCNAHHHWMKEHPDAVAFGQAWADQNLEDLSAAELHSVNSSHFGDQLATAWPIK
jgi:hypothetical protein